MWKRLLVFALGLQLVSGRISPFDPEDNLRPDNITGLDYSHYKNIGSYYNGTLTFSLRLYPQSKHDGAYLSGDICDEFINETLRLTFDAVLGVQKSGKNQKSKNPFMLNIWAWDQNFALSPTTETANYSEFQRFDLVSEDFQEPVWAYNLTNSTNSTEAVAKKYGFKGLMTDDWVMRQPFKFNTTGTCESKSSANQTFTGYFLAPHPKATYSWTNEVMVPGITGQFDDFLSMVVIVGMFEAIGVNTLVAGEFSAIFSGQIDEDRSDHLKLKLKTPEWDAILGFGGGEKEASSGGAVIWRPSQASTLSLVLWIAYVVAW